MHLEPHPLDIRVETTPQASVFKRGAVILPAGRPGLLGRVRRGLLSLTDPGCDDGALVIALPGDLIGIESLKGEAVALQARAIVAAEVEWLTLVRADQWRQLLVEGLLARQAHQGELARLRRGSVPERVRQLLLLLSGKAAGVRPPAEEAPLQCELPSLLDMSLLVDTSPETVSRVLSALRRSGQLETPRGRLAVLAPELGRPDWAKSVGMTRSRTVDAPMVQQVA